MLFGDLNPPTKEKHWQLHLKVGCDLASTINYVIKTWFQNNFIYTNLAQGLVPKEKSKYNFALNNNKKKHCINPCKFSKSDTKTLFSQT
jgi:hypothetical protein